MILKLKVNKENNLYNNYGNGLHLITSCPFTMIVNTR